MKAKKIISALLASAMLMGLAAGCGNSGTGNNTDANSGNTGQTDGTSNSGEGADTSEEVELTMYLLGDKTPDFDEVYGKINEILKEKCNATVNVKFLTWGEHETKYSLLFTSQEDFDLIFTASDWAHYEETVAMGGFYPLTMDFIKSYAPDIAEAVPEKAWKQAEIDGTMYMVPNYQNEYGQDCMLVRGDLMKKYGIDSIKGWDDFEKYCDAIIENEDGISPLANQGVALQYAYAFQSEGYDVVPGTPDELFVYNYADASDTEIKYMLDWDHFKDYAYKMKEMFDKGYWSADSVASSDERQTAFLNGQAACMVWNLGACYTYANEANEKNPDWDCQIIDLCPNAPKKVNAYINNGIAINANSKHKERAMMVLNEFYTNPEVFDLAMLGIEGKHWEAVGDDKYKIIDESNYGVNSNCNWGWTNINIRRDEYMENETSAYKQEQALLENWDANQSEGHLFDTFSFDTSNVTTEVATVTSLVTQYYDPITYGMVDDVDAAIEELRKQLDAAGIQRIADEIQRQAFGE